MSTPAKPISVGAELINGLRYNGRKAIHTCDDNLRPAPVGAALVTAGTDVDAGVTWLNFGEVQLSSCTHRWVSMGHGHIHNALPCLYMNWKLMMYLVCVCQHCLRWVGHPLWTSRNSAEDCRTPDTAESRGPPGWLGPSRDKPSPLRRLQLQGAKVTANSHFLLSNETKVDRQH